MQVTVLILKQLDSSRDLKVSALVYFFSLTRIIIVIISAGTGLMSRKTPHHKDLFHSKVMFNSASSFHYFNENRLLLFMLE